jgi:hypothetical protein
MGIKEYFSIYLNQNMKINLLIHAYFNGNNK